MIYRRQYRMSKKDKIKTVKFSVLNDYKVKIVLTRNLDKALKSYKHTTDVNSGGETTGGITVHVDCERLSYVFIPYGSSTGSMAHEAYHAIRHMLEECSIELENEVVAYHLGYLMNEIVDLALQ